MASEFQSATLLRSGSAKLNTWVVGLMYDGISTAASMGVPLYGDDYLHLGYYPSPVISFEEAQLQLTKKVLDPLQLGPGKKLLDVGCGTGETAVYAAETSGCGALGVTVSRRQVESGGKKAAAKGLSDRVEIRLADAQQLDVAEASFDGAIAIESIGHMIHKDRALAGIRRALKPGAKFSFVEITVEHRGPIITGLAYLTGTTPVWSSGEAVEKIRGAGFEIEAVDDMTPSLVRSLEHLEHVAVGMVGRGPAKKAAHFTASLLGRAFAGQRNRMGFFHVLARNPA